MLQAPTLAGSLKDPPRCPRSHDDQADGRLLYRGESNPQVSGTTITAVDLPFREVFEFYSYHFRGGKTVAHHFHPHSGHLRHVLRQNVHARGAFAVILREERQSKLTARVPLGGLRGTMRSKLVRP